MPELRLAGSSGRGRIPQVPSCSLGQSWDERRLGIHEAIWSLGDQRLRDSQERCESRSVGERPRFDLPDGHPEDEVVVRGLLQAIRR